MLLDKIPEALDHLNPENVQNINIELPAEENETRKIKTAPPSSMKYF